MAHDPTALPPEVTEFLTERHLATLTTLRADGSPHVVPVAFTWDASTNVTGYVVKLESSAITLGAGALTASLPTP